jgi:hypothetical protein
MLRRIYCREKGPPNYNKIIVAYCQACMDNITGAVILMCMDMYHSVCDILLENYQHPIIAQDQKLLRLADI